MKFIKLIIKNGIFDQSEDLFSPASNLLFSKNNSVGKSTYLRILFYALGYQIPSMYGLDFERIETILVLENSEITYSLERQPKNLMVKYYDKCINYSLPSEHMDFLSEVFKTSNEFVLSNLLGVMYVDQEKGWTLLNRGIVIGRNRFDIDKLLIGLGNIDCKSELILKDKLEKENKKYKSIIDINEFKNEILESNNDISFDNVEKDVKSKIDYTNLIINKIKQDMKNIDSVIHKNKSLFNYLTNLRLVVVSENGEEIPVNEKNLRAATETNEMLITRKNILSIELRKKEEELIALRKELNDYYMNNNEITKVFGIDLKADEGILIKSIANLDINLAAIQDNINYNSHQLTALKDKISKEIMGNHELVSKIFERIYQYCEELGISSKILNDPSFLYTDKLKMYSGTDFHKLVIAFKVALHLSMEEYLDTSIPFVLDSPSGRELNEKNIELTVNFVKSKLQKSQLFLASIKDFQCEKILYFKERAIEDHNIEFSKLS